MRDLSLLFTAGSFPVALVIIIVVIIIVVIIIIW